MWEPVAVAFICISVMFGTIAVSLYFDRQKRFHELCDALNIPPKFKGIVTFERLVEVARLHSNYCRESLQFLLEEVFEKIKKD